MKYIIGKSSINRNKLGTRVKCGNCKREIETKKALIMPLNKDKPNVSFVCKWCYLKKSRVRIEVWKYNIMLKTIKSFQYSRKYAIMITLNQVLEISKETIKSLKKLKLFPKSYFIYTNQKKLEKLAGFKLGGIKNG